MKKRGANVTSKQKELLLLYNSVIGQKKKSGMIVER